MCVFGKVSISQDVLWLQLRKSYPFQKAAVYAHHIITGHIFLDGNKRIGLTCALRFLELNGYSRLSNIDDSIIELGFKIADGTITEIEGIADRIQSWIL